MGELRLLVVANPYESAMMRRAAEHAGVRVREADVEEAEVAIAEAAPHVVVLAVATTHGDPLALAERLRLVRGASGAPRLIMVGGTGAPVRTLEDARARGADDFLSRPVDLKALVVKVLAAGGRPETAAPQVPDLGDVVAAHVDAALEGALDRVLETATPPPSAGSHGAVAPSSALPPAATAVAPPARPVGPPPLSPVRAAPRPPAPAAPEPVGPSPPPSLSLEEMLGRRTRIEAQVVLIGEGDYFAVLGVGRAATGAEVRRAYDAACRYFDPALLGDVGRERARDLAVIRTVLDECLRVLGDDAVRVSYLMHLPQP